MKRFYDCVYWADNQCELYFGNCHGCRLYTNVKKSKIKTNDCINLIGATCRFYIEDCNGCSLYKKAEEEACVDCMWL